MKHIELNEKLVATKLRQSTKVKMEIIKAYLRNNDDFQIKKIGKSDYELVRTLVDAEYERIKPEINNQINSAD